MEKCKCRLCGYIYNAEKGDPQRNINKGTQFEDLPVNWVCPSCGAKKKIFNKIE
ncbi:MAG: rubredoxin [Methanobacterium sp.]|nr:rubredoxin [Methanobacterium sp.]